MKAKGYEGKCRLVEYYDPETFHGSFRETEPVFRKQVIQSYQRNSESLSPPVRPAIVP